MLILFYAVLDHGRGTIAQWKAEGAVLLPSQDDAFPHVDVACHRAHLFRILLLCG